MNSFLKLTSKVVLIGMFALMLTPPSSFAKTLRMLTSYPPHIELVAGSIKIIKDTLVRLSDGKMNIKILGPDVVPTLEQFQPLQAGVFDMFFGYGGYHTSATAIGVLPDAMIPDPAKMRQKGIFKYIDEHYNRLGVKVIAMFPTTEIHIQTRFPLEGRNPSLSGLKIRTGASLAAMMKTFGGSPVITNPGEVYMSLQKGVLDGGTALVFGGRSYKWHEVTKYMTRPTFGGITMLVLMNMNKYNQLSAEERQFVDETGKVAELECAKFFSEKTESEDAFLKEYGIKETQFRPEDARRLNKLYSKGLWELAIKKDGKTAELLRELAAKQGMLR
jgi:TRAP-type transport system periplasmic protein